MKYKIRHKNIFALFIFVLVPLETIVQDKVNATIFETDCMPICMQKCVAILF